MIFKIFAVIIFVLLRYSFKPPAAVPASPESDAGQKSTTGGGSIRPAKPHHKLPLLYTATYNRHLLQMTHTVLHPWMSPDSVQSGQTYAGLGHWSVCHGCGVHQVYCDSFATGYKENESYLRHWQKHIFKTINEISQLFVHSCCVNQINLFLVFYLWMSGSPMCVAVSSDLIFGQFCDFYLYVTKWTFPRKH